MSPRTVVTAALLGLALAIPAEAQEAGKPARSVPRGRKVIRLGTTVIEGTIQKPQAFYILQRSSLNLEGLELKNSFVPKILKSVDEEPF
ncbi:MAG: hypothetical protein HY791_00680 [Deltaproteobacteria bacterium]|nr:hypothetical protein [Deltaproteobacteria bacterium]